MRKIKRALISLSNKQNLKELLLALAEYKIKIISSGGTYKEIKKLKFKCTDVSNYTNSPEILGGRIKTLHPKIHSGILSKRNNKSHIKDLSKNNFKEIDLVIVNFYPFEKTLESTKNNEKIIENIDIGGPAMVRSAAKNYKDVVVITNPSQYEEFIKELNIKKGGTSLNFRKKFSAEAFLATTYYDSIITDYFNKLNSDNFPKKKIVSLNLIEKLRYGENPHQESAIYSFKKNLNLKKINGKKLSYNNYNDIYSAIKIAKTLPNNLGTIIIKHTNPCGVSIIKDPIKSYKLALASDPVSAFGGIVYCNYKLKKNLALELHKNFLEVIIANGFEKSALKVLTKKKNLRLIDASKINFSNVVNFTSNLDSVLIQSNDSQKFTKKDFKIVSKKKPNKNQFDNLIFAFNVCRYVKSNSIVLVSNKSTLGIGSGQPSRLDSCQIAIDKMNKFVKPNDEIVAASDAFFPFVDGIEKLVQSGISAIIQPEGSIRDKEIIKFSNSTDTVLVFSKTRHFRH